MMTFPAERHDLRLVVVDDVESTRRFLCAVFQTVSDLEVVAAVGTGRAAIESATQLQPDVVLLDLDLPDYDGSVVLPELRRVAPGAKIVVLSNRARLNVLDLIAAGATGAIEKGKAPLDLIEQLALVLGVPLNVTGGLSLEMERKYSIPQH